MKETPMFVVVLCTDSTPNLQKKKKNVHLLYQCMAKQTFFPACCVMLGPVVH